jgi:hypothetical protein
LKLQERLENVLEWLAFHETFISSQTRSEELSAIACYTLRLLQVLVTHPIETATTSTNDSASPSPVLCTYTHSFSLSLSLSLSLPLLQSCFFQFKSQRGLSLQMSVLMDWIASGRFWRTVCQLLLHCPHHEVRVEIATRLYTFISTIPDNFKLSTNTLFDSITKLFDYFNWD